MTIEIETNDGLVRLEGTVVSMEQAVSCVDAGGRMSFILKDYSMVVNKPTPEPFVNPHLEVCCAGMEGQ